MKKIILLISLVLFGLVLTGCPSPSSDAPMGPAGPVYLGTATVSFDANGGEGTMEPLANKDIGSGWQLPYQYGFTNEYGGFLGWSTDKDATEPEYKEGESYIVTGDVTLYAIWYAYTLVTGNLESNVLTITASQDGTGKPLKATIHEYAANRATITNIVIEDPGTGIKILPEERLNGLFTDVDEYGRLGSNFFSVLTSIEGLEHIDTSKVTSMDSLFYGCTALTTIDISGWDTSNVEQMIGMFSYTGLTTLDISSLDTSSARFMQGMFETSSDLTQIDFGYNWNTSEVIDMSKMFAGCSALTSVTVNDWNTEKVQNMSYMFSGCSALTSFDGATWNTASVTNMSNMFAACGSIAHNLNLSNWNTANVTDMSSMFKNFTSAATVNFTGWDTGSVRNMQSMFEGATAFTSFDLSRWDTKSVKNMSAMFKNATNALTINLSNWDVQAVTDMESMFDGCSSATRILVTDWNPKSVTTMRSMFNGCTALEEINVYGWGTSSLNNASKMFEGCVALTAVQNLATWNPTSLEYAYSMFEDCTVLTMINLSGWSIPAGTSLDGMFDGCINVNTAKGKTQADCDRLNASSYKAANVNFVVQ